MSQVQKKRKVTVDDAAKPKVDWDLIASDVSERTINYIRNVVDTLKIPKGDGTKSLIPLSIGDPTAFGNLDPPHHLATAMIKHIQGQKFNGYAPSTGHVSCRTAIAKRYSTPEAPLTPEDIIVTSGCSGALVIAIQGLASVGDNILCPSPGFCLYETAAGHTGINFKHYNLRPEKQWEVDLDSLESLIDDRTKAIVVNNPSNPCGANYSKEHLIEILALAEKHKLPIIADEIYQDMVFGGAKCYSLSHLTTEVPIISCGGIAKQYLVPGWRVGWLMINDRHDRFGKGVRDGLLRLSQLILGANTLAQAAVPDLLEDTSDEYYTDLIAQLERQSDALVKNLEGIDCLEVIEPQGAMYVMARVCVEKLKDIKDDREFVQKLLDEEMVFLLPGQCFRAPNFVRFVFCAPEKVLIEAADRIKSFCERHRR